MRVVPPSDLREWIPLLERDGELASVSAGADPTLEITRDRLPHDQGAPALLDASHSF
jgi:3-polyprenyl-4-hydroxybenzoate decarboxylase